MNSQDVKGQPEKKNGDKLIDKLAILSEIEDKKITIRYLLEILGTSAAHIMVIVLCSPSALPLPAIPVITQVLAFSVMLILAQLFVGKKEIWLPKKILNKELDSGFLKKASGKLLQYHKKIEKFIQPRLSTFFSYLSLRVIYLFCIILSICVAIPIPFSNTAPSIALIIIILGLVEKDGVILILGVIAGLIGLTLILGLYIYGTVSLFN